MAAIGVSQHGKPFIMSAAASFDCFKSKYSILCAGAGEDSASDESREGS
jgi:hypothetical protein